MLVELGLSFPLLWFPWLEGIWRLWSLTNILHPIVSDASRRLAHSGNAIANLQKHYRFSASPTSICSYRQGNPTVSRLLPEKEMCKAIHAHQKGLLHRPRHHQPHTGPIHPLFCYRFRKARPTPQMWMKLQWFAVKCGRSLGEDIEISPDAAPRRISQSH